MRIAYVEDNPTNLALVERVASMNQHVIVSYNEGEIALQELQHEKFDLILMDVELAGELSGLQVVRQLRTKGIRTPMIAVTAYAMMGDRDKCLEAGCNDYLPKPLPIRELIDMLNRYDMMIKNGEPIPVPMPVGMISPSLPLMEMETAPVAASAGTGHVNAPAPAPTAPPPAQPAQPPTPPTNPAPAATTPTAPDTAQPANPTNDAPTPAPSPTAPAGPASQTPNTPTPPTTTNANTANPSAATNNTDQKPESTPPAESASVPKPDTNQPGDGKPV